MTTCPQCGRAIPPELAGGARFCPFCGASLPVEPASPADLDGTSTLHLSSLGGQTDVDSSAVAADEGLPGEEGADAGDLPAEASAAVEALPPGSAMLVVLHGPSAGSRFLLDTPEVAAGRQPDSDVFLDDVTVSRRHAEFIRDEDGHYDVRDVGSLNGTYVNRDRVDRRQLHNRDEVQIGKYRLVYFEGSAFTAGATAPA